MIHAHNRTPCVPSAKEQGGANLSTSSEGQGREKLPVLNQDVMARIAELGGPRTVVDFAATSRELRATALRPSVLRRSLVEAGTGAFLPPASTPGSVLQLHAQNRAVEFFRRRAGQLLAGPKLAEESEGRIVVAGHCAVAVACGKQFGSPHALKKLSFSDAGIRWASLQVPEDSYFDSLSRDGRWCSVRSGVRDPHRTWLLFDLLGTALSPAVVEAFRDCQTPTFTADQKAFVGYDMTGDELIFKRVDLSGSFPVVQDRRVACSFFEQRHGAVSFSPQGRFAVVNSGGDASFKVVEVVGNKPSTSIALPVGNAISEITWSLDETTIIAYDDASQPPCAFTYNLLEAAPRAIRVNFFSSLQDSRLLHCASDKFLCLLTPESGQDCFQLFDLQGAPVSAQVESPLGGPFDERLYEQKIVGTKVLFARTFRLPDQPEFASFLIDFAQTPATRAIFPQDFAEASPADFHEDSVFIPGYPTGPGMYTTPGRLQKFHLYLQPSNLAVPGFAMPTTVNTVENRRWVVSPTARWVALSGDSRGQDGAALIHALPEVA